MLKIARIMEDLDAPDRGAVAFEVYRTYAGPSVDDAEMLLAQRRESDRERQARVRESRDLSRDGPETSRDTEGDTNPSSTSTKDLFLEARSNASKKESQVLTTEAVDRAKRELPGPDFDFLQACPEPFRTQWLVDPAWWVSLRDGYPRIDAPREASKCMTYVQGKFSKKQQDRLQLRERLRRWIAKADRWRENGEERKAVRR